MRPPKPSTVTRIASQTRPIPCNCGHFPKQDDSDMRVLNKAIVTMTAFPDGPDPCDSSPVATLWQLPPNRQLSRR